MNPAKAMGTFLRVWRSEWAGLSRAQLAIALQGVSSKAKGITARVIRRWEEGQPPGTTEELEALCRVMRRHGLAPLEVKQFQQTVFSACVDRQYPELFGGEEWCRREDIEEVARSILLRWASGGGPPSPVLVVSLVKELERAVREEQAGAAARRLRQEQLRALAWLYRLLSSSHTNPARHGLAAASYAAEATFARVHLGSQCPNAVLHPAVSTAHAIKNAILAGDSPEGFWRIPEIARDIQGAPPPHGDAFIFFVGADTAAIAGTREQRDYVRAHVAPYLRDQEAGANQWESEYAHYTLFKCAVRDGLLREAEGHVEGFQEWEHGVGDWAVWWGNAMADFALASGNRGEADRYLEQVRVTCRRLRLDELLPSEP